MSGSRDVFAIVLVVAISGCRLETERAMHETIAMGPFTFVVEGARKEPRSPCDAIIVDLRLQESSGAKVHFDEFLNDTASRKMISFPNVAIVDRRGHRFTGWVSRVSGRESWRAEFHPDEGKPWADRPTVCGSWSPPDFRLTINNPDRRKGQSLRVRVPLG